MTLPALVFLVVALAPAVALALHLDLERADAKRRTRDRLRGPRAALQAAQAARPSVDRLLADLRFSLTTWQRHVLEALLPAAAKAAEDLSRTMAKVSRVLAKTGNPPGRRPELAGSDERISR